MRKYAKECFISYNVFTLHSDAVVLLKWTGHVYSEVKTFFDSNTGKKEFFWLDVMWTLETLNFRLFHERSALNFNWACHGFCSN